MAATEISSPAPPIDRHPQEGLEDPLRKAPIGETIVISGDTWGVTNARMAARGTSTTLTDRAA
jgi:hypothetical protein